MALLVPTSDLTGHSEWFEPIGSGGINWDVPLFSQLNDSEDSVTASATMDQDGASDAAVAVCQLTTTTAPPAGTVTFRVSWKATLQSGTAPTEGAGSFLDAKIGPSTLIGNGHLFQNRVFALTPNFILGGGMVTYSAIISTIAPAVITAWDTNNDWADLVVWIGAQVFGGADNGVVKVEFGFAELEVPNAGPSAPSGLTATEISALQVDLTWNDNSSDEDNFEIDRADGAGPWVPLAEPAANVESYSDTTTYGDETFHYRIRAVNGSGNSAYDTEDITIDMPWWESDEPWEWLQPNPTRPTTPASTEVPWFWETIFYPGDTVLVWTEVAAPSDEGWWFSLEQYAGNALVVSNSRPKNPRTYEDINMFATGSAATMGGFPGVAGTINNRLVYADTDYTVGTDRPTIRLFDGNFDREICAVPKTAAAAIPKAVMSILVANGTVYVSTLDSGTTATTWAGRVFELDIVTGQLTPLGTPFTGGHVPYALAWHAGRLWCGTNTGDPTEEGTVRFFRPGIDTDWTTEHTLAVGCVTSLMSYKGLLYVGCSAPAATAAVILVRSAANAYTTSGTGTGGTKAANNAFLSMAEFGGNLYAGWWNPNTPADANISKFDNTTWTTVYSGTGGTIVPYVVLAADGDTLYALGGSMPYEAVLLTTANGTSWTNRTAFLPQSIPASTGLNAFGMVVL